MIVTNRLMQQNRKLSHVVGFTLIELMVAITIVGILLSVGLPAMRDMLLNQKLRTAASDMHLSLMFARSEAIKRNANIVVANNGAGWDVRFGTTVLRTQALEPEITIACDTDKDGAADACPASITFARTGRANTFIDFRMYINGNTKVTMRCVSLRLSGVPQVTLDSDSITADGCD